MKILWKNVWYNLVARRWHLIKYYWKKQHKNTYYPLSDWSRWYYPYKQPWTKKQENKLNAELDVATKKLKFQRPLSLSASDIYYYYYIYHDPIIRFPELNHTPQQLNAPWQGEQENADDKSIEQP